jgi:citrate synthase
VSETQTQEPGGVAQAGDDSLTVTDNRTGRTYEIPITNGTVRAMDFRQMKVDEEDFGLMTYDPAYTNTASCRSEITFIDGDRGILEYRGYPIEELAERSTYLEVAYLLVHGELPTQQQLDEWAHQITIHTFVHENVKEFVGGFRHDAHPMGMLLGSVGALSTFYPDANNIHDEQNRMIQTIRLIAKVPTLAAFAYRHTQGQPYVYPDNDLKYAGNFLNMMYKMTELKYEPDPRLERALDVLFILHADHEQNCSTSTVRMVGSSDANLYASIAAGINALWGPLHGGANQAVIEMLEQIQAAGSGVDRWVTRAKDPDDPFRLSGFGHRVYKNYDPRARILKDIAAQVIGELGGGDELLDLAHRLEEVALADEFFVERKLYPNVDFYSGLIYRAMGFPTKMFPVLFAMGRLPGWIAHWKEMMESPRTKIGRPRQIYCGPTERKYLPIDQRG